MKTDTKSNNVFLSVVIFDLRNGIFVLASDSLFVRDLGRGAPAAQRSDRRRHGGASAAQHGASVPSSESVLRRGRTHRQSPHENPANAAADTTGTAANAAAVATSPTAASGDAAGSTAATAAGSAKHPDLATRPGGDASNTSAVHSSASARPAGVRSQSTCPGSKRRDFAVDRASSRRTECDAAELPRDEIRAHAAQRHGREQSARVLWLAGAR